MRLSVVLLAMVALFVAAPADAPQPMPEPRLIGLGCGPKHLTMTANEEDEFPAPCYAIGTKEELCPPDPAFPILEDEPIELEECLNYLGDGW